MKKITVAFIVLFSASLLLPSCTDSGVLLSDFRKPPIENSNVFQASQNARLLQSMECDLYRNGDLEKIEFYTIENEEGVPIFWILAVNDHEKVILQHEDGLYSHAQIELQDILGNGTIEVLVYRYSTGSSGATHLNIYNPSVEQWTSVFSSQDYASLHTDRFKIKYIGNHQVEFWDTEANMQTIIPLDTAQYVETEDMLQDISTWIDPISQYEIKDLDADLIPEILSMQRVIGINHADTIGIIQCIYTLTDGQYRLTDLSLHDCNGIELTKIKF